MANTLPIDQRSDRAASGVEPGDRLFLDANVLFSAAYRSDSGVRVLWSLGETARLLTTAYAAEEARRNLSDGTARHGLEQLLHEVDLVPDALTGDLPNGVTLPAKDQPILLSAIGARPRTSSRAIGCTLARISASEFAGILIERPADCVRRERHP